ncbi:MAG TPA: putative ATP-grasp-modified RiPP [Mycobacteriales bacterium]|nr:putative ATP-grasp-modified RiPP [Mycobacteriales bacterium]
MTFDMITHDDVLFRAADQFPLGQRPGVVAASDSQPSDPAARPFGLRFAGSPASAIPVDLSALRYDEERQISVDETGAPAFDKHSTGKTNTRTSDGHQSMDSDTDYTED